MWLPLDTHSNSTGVILPHLPTTQNCETRNSCPMTQKPGGTYLMAKPPSPHSLIAGNVNVLDSPASAVRAEAYSVSYQDTQGEKSPQIVRLLQPGVAKRRETHPPHVTLPPSRPAVRKPKQNKAHKGKRPLPNLKPTRPCTTESILLPRPSQ